MTKEDVDRLIEAINNGETEIMLTYVKDLDLTKELENVDLDNPSIEIAGKVEKDIILQIENSGYEVWSYALEKFASIDNTEAIVKYTSNIDYMKNSMQDETLQIGEEKDELKARIDSIIYLREILNSENDKVKNSESIEKTRINLPSKMTIGMEIECEGTSSSTLVNNFEYENWITKLDASLLDGIEIVSPIMYSTQENTNEIYVVNGVLNKLGMQISDRCGGHIHIGADYLTSIQSYENLLEIWCNNEKSLYAMSNEKGIAPREHYIQYAPPISPKIEKALEEGTISIEDEEGLDKFIKAIKEVQYRGNNPRYSGINFMNVNDTKNTIEFRLANGTINPEMWIENANLFGGIVAISEELAEIQKNGARSEAEQDKLEKFEKLKQDIDEKEKVEILLGLVGVEPETYMERYESNIELIKENQATKEVFAGKEPLDFKAAKDKFKGKESEEIKSSARMQIEARDNIAEGHERNLQNERTYIH